MYPTSDVTSPMNSMVQPMNRMVQAMPPPPLPQSPIDGALGEQRNLLEQALRQIRALTVRLEPVLDGGTVKQSRDERGDAMPEPMLVYGRICYSNDQARELMNLMNAINERLQL